jgi:hypothetical protein
VFESPLEWKKSACSVQLLNPDLSACTITGKLFYEGRIKTMLVPLPYLGKISREIASFLFLEQKQTGVLQGE